VSGVQNLLMACYEITKKSVHGYTKFMIINNISETNNTDKDVHSIKNK
jgi:hypothetical protein